MTRARIAILSLLCVCGQAWGQTLKRVAAIDLPGPVGQRFDYLTIVLAQNVNRVCNSSRRLLALSEKPPKPPSPALDD